MAAATVINDVLGILFILFAVLAFWVLFSFFFFLSLTSYLRFLVVAWGVVKLSSKGFYLVRTTIIVRT